MKVIKFFLGILLLLPCAALTLTLFNTAAALGLGNGPWLHRPVFWCLLGFACWLAIFGLLSPSSRAYVISHELTHAFWTLMMGGRVSGMKAGASGGQVKVSKENWLITLSPYFFPLYTLLALAIYYGLGFVGDVRPFAPVLYYAVGFSWSFHLTFTLMVLRQSQTDIQRHGWLFSMVVIYGMNLLVIAMLLTLLSQRVALTGLGGDFANQWIVCWRWLVHTWGMLRKWWHQVTWLK